MRDDNMIANGEILQLRNRGTHQIAKVAVKRGKVYEMVNVELTGNEYETMCNGTMPANERGEIVARALTMNV